MKAAVSAEYSYAALREPLPKQPPELHIVSVRRAQSRPTTKASLQAIAIFAAVVAALALVIYSNVQITELGKALGEQEKEYQSLIDMNSRMQVQLEEKISLRNVEEYATGTLGMAQMEGYQVSYVNLGEQNHVEVYMNAKPSLWQAAKDSAKALMEYIRH